MKHIRITHVQDYKQKQKKKQNKKKWEGISLFFAWEQANCICYRLGLRNNIWHLWQYIKYDTQRGQHTQPTRYSVFQNCSNTSQHWTVLEGNCKALKNSGRGKKEMKNSNKDTKAGILKKEEGYRHREKRNRLIQREKSEGHWKW